MKISYPSMSINHDDIVDVLNNNEEVSLEFNISPSTGIVIRKSNSHFAGYKPQPCIEVSFFEEDGHGWSKACYGTEYFNDAMAERAANAALERLRSVTPVSISTFGVSFESTFVKEGE